MAGVIIGIDLGTTNSCVAVLEGGIPRIIENKEGNRTTPSIVAYTESGEILVGSPAKRQAVTNPENTLFEVKRLMGRKFQDPEVKNMAKHVPYKIFSGPNGDSWIKTQTGKEISAQEFSGKILRYLKETAEAFLGTEVTEAVVTVPAYFNDSQRQATKDAGTIAGLKIERILNEPTAAALAYGLDKKKEGIIIVYDLGGGTFDVSVLEIADGVFEVKSTNGDTFLGGADFDNRLQKYIIEEFEKANPDVKLVDPLAIQRVKEAAEKAKIELSSSMEHEVNIPYITANQTGPKHLVVKISRSKLESLVEDLIQKTIEPCKKAMKDANITINDISDVVMVGGMTRMPRVVEVVKKFFGKEPNRGVNPDEVVAIGAAIQGGILRGDVKDVLLLDVTPLTLGIETMGGVLTPLIERNTTIPTKRSQVFSTAADNQTAVTISIFQGERPMAADNKLLGTFNLEGIASAPRGLPQIEVTFDINGDGIVHVSAKDKATGKEQKIVIKSGSGLSDEEIKQMLQEAEANAEKDKQRAALAIAKNEAGTLINQTEKSLKEHESKIDASLKSEIEGEITSLNEMLMKENLTLSELQEANQRLQEKSMKMGEQIYKQSSEGDAGSSAAGSNETTGGSNEEGGESNGEDNFRNVN